MLHDCDAAANSNSFRIYLPQPPAGWGAALLRASRRCYVECVQILLSCDDSDGRFDINVPDSVRGLAGARWWLC